MENKTSLQWYKRTPVIIALLIFLFPIGLFLMWRYTNWDKKTKWIVTGLVVLMIVGSGGKKSNSQNENNIQTLQQEVTLQPTIEQASASPTQSKKLYERFSYEDLSTMEYIVFIYYGQDKTEPYLNKLTQSIKNEQCKKPCSIALFDDPSAAELDKEVKGIKNEAQEKEWRRKHYIFVADHFPAFLEFSGTFFHYMYKGWGYDELKKTN